MTRRLEISLENLPQTCLEKRLEAPPEEFPEVLLGAKNETRYEGVGREAVVERKTKIPKIESLSAGSYFHGTAFADNELKNISK